jgi:hypothetical protein
MLMDVVGGQGFLAVHGCRFDQLGMSVQSQWDIRIYDNEILVWSGIGINTSVGAERLFIYDNWFFGGIGASGGKGVLITEGDALIEGNVFDFSQTGMRGTPIIVDRFPTRVVVRNNLIIGGRTPIIWTWTTGVVENNTIVGPENPYNDFAVFLADEDSLVFRNNAFHDFPGGPMVAYYPSGPITMLHNSFWPPTNSYVRVKASIDSSLLDIRDSANVNAYPMFAEDETDELGWTSFRLQRGSPLIDAGAPDLLDVDSTVSDVGWTGGPGGVHYEYPELPPLGPESLQVTGDDQIVTVTWPSRPEADLHSYRLYRSTTSGFWAPALVPHRETSAADTSLCDTLLTAGESYYYVCTAVDTAMLESQPSPESEYTVTGVGDDPGLPVVPRTPSIRRVYPNPFNSAVTLEVYIPDVSVRPAPVEVIVYNLLGQVLSFAFKGTLEPGIHQLVWDGRAADGSPSASGLYFAHLRVWGREFGPPKKIVLLK